MPVSTAADISILLRDGLAVVSCHGELDLLSIRDLERTLGDVIETSPRSVHVDLSRVPFLAQSGVGMLVRIARRCTQSSIHLAIVGSDAVLQTLDVAGAADVLPIRAAAVVTGTPDQARPPHRTSSFTLRDLATAR